MTILVTIGDIFLATINTINTINNDQYQLEMFRQQALCTNWWGNCSNILINDVQFSCFWALSNRRIRHRAEEKRAKRSIRQPGLIHVIDLDFCFISVCLFFSIRLQAVNPKYWI